MGKGKGDVIVPLIFPICIVAQRIVRRLKFMVIEADTLTNDQ